MSETLSADLLRELCRLCRVMIDTHSYLGTRDGLPIRRSYITTTCGGFERTWQAQTIGTQLTIYNSEIVLGNALRCSPGPMLSERDGEITTLFAFSASDCLDLLDHLRKQLVLNALAEL
ncbi:MAG: hypothetical protein AB7L09_01695 [Nitrospira sp.]